MGALPHYSPDDDGDDLPAAVARTARRRSAAPRRSSSAPPSTPAHCPARSRTSSSGWSAAARPTASRSPGSTSPGRPRPPAGPTRTTRCARWSGTSSMEIVEDACVRIPVVARRGRRGRPHRRPGHPRAAGGGAGGAARGRGASGAAVASCGSYGEAPPNGQRTTTATPSRQPRDGHVHPRPAEGHALGLEQRALALALGQRAVGAHDAVPRDGRVVAREEHRAGPPRRAGRDVAVGAHEARRDRPHAVEDALGSGHRARR